jgi:hypothetical protein
MAAIAKKQNEEINNEKLQKEYDEKFPAMDEDGNVIKSKSGLKSDSKSDSKSSSKSYIPKYQTQLTPFVVNLHPNDTTFYKYGAMAKAAHENANYHPIVILAPNMELWEIEKSLRSIAKMICFKTNKGTKIQTQFEEYDVMIEDDIDEESLKDYVKKYAQFMINEKKMDNKIKCNEEGCDNLAKNIHIKEGAKCSDHNKIYLDPEYHDSNSTYDCKNKQNKNKCGAKAIMFYFQKDTYGWHCIHCSRYFEEMETIFCPEGNECNKIECYYHEEDFKHKCPFEKKGCQDFRIEHQSKLIHTPCKYGDKCKIQEPHAGHGDIPSRYCGFQDKPGGCQKTNDAYHMKMFRHSNRKQMPVKLNKIQTSIKSMSKAASSVPIDNNIDPIKTVKITEIKKTDQKIIKMTIDRSPHGPCAACVFRGHYLCDKMIQSDKGPNWCSQSRFPTNKQWRLYLEKTKMETLKIETSKIDEIKIETSKIDENIDEKIIETRITEVSV